MCRMRFQSRMALSLAAGCLIAAFQPGWAQAQEARVEPPAPQANCELLYNPEMRQKIGSGLEMKLMRLCEEQTEGVVEERPATTEVEVEEKPVEFPDESQNSGGRADVLVNDPKQDSVGTTQSETSIAVVGGWVCAAWNDSGQIVEGLGLSGFGLSKNKGKTWTDQGAFPPGEVDGEADVAGSDPSLAYSVRDRRFYYAALSDVGMSLWESRDKCRTFDYVGPIHRGADDKELIAVDNNRRSPYFGRIYVGWTNFALADDLNQTSYSDDRGLNWSDPVSLPGSGTNGQGMWPAVAPNGDVYFALLERSFSVGGLQDQRIYQSVTGGDAWSEVTPIGEDQLRPENVASSSFCGRQALNGNIKNLSSPQIAIHRDKKTSAAYVIHAVYPYDSDGAGPDESNVFYRRSEDGGSTWSTEVQVNGDGTTTDQWFPAVAVSEGGRVVVSWYDRRVDTANNLAFARFADVSPDGGKSWGPNFQVSDVTSDVAQTQPNFDPTIRPTICYHGDYDQIAVSGNDAHITWSDDRRETETGPNPDIYAETIDLKRPPRADGVLVAVQ